MYTIHFAFEKTGLLPLELKEVESGQSILELALTNQITLRHQCGGICACTTCHLYIEKGMEYIEELSIREVDFIERAFKPRSNSRLACQALLQEGSGFIKVTIPDQAIF